MYAPILDVARDQRWGRIEETYGEDPYLVAAMGIALAKGIQHNGQAASTIPILKAQPKPEKW